MIKVRFKNGHPHSPFVSVYVRYAPKGFVHWNFVVIFVVVAVVAVVDIVYVFFCLELFLSMSSFFLVLSISSFRIILHSDSVFTGFFVFSVLLFVFFCFSERKVGFSFFFLVLLFVVVTVVVVVVVVFVDDVFVFAVVYLLFVRFYIWVREGGGGAQKLRSNHGF